MDAQRINGYSSRTLLVLSLVALVTVAIGFTQPPLPDEGTLAHIFQIAIVLLAPTGLVFLATADWDRPLDAVRRLVAPGVATVFAFAALYYLEHVFYAGR